MPDENKRCYKCGDHRPPTQFSSDRSRKDGLANVCKTCESARGKERNAAATEARRLSAKINPKPTPTQQQCWACKKVSPLDCFYRDKSSATGYARCCKDCSRERRRGWRGRGYEKYIADKKTKEKNQIDTISDSYIRHLLAKNTCLSRSQIPSELVELKRLQILITRKTNEASQ